MINLYPRGSLDLVSPHFRAREFDCPCKNSDCEFTMISEAIVQIAEHLREHVRSSVVIDSGFRCGKHQADLKAKGLETAAGRSTHEDGRAIDCWVSGYSGPKLAAVLGVICGARAVGVFAHSVHVDDRNDKGRLWFYKSVSNAKDFTKP